MSKRGTEIEKNYQRRQNSLPIKGAIKPKIIKKGIGESLMDQDDIDYKEIHKKSMTQLAMEKKNK